MLRKTIAQTKAPIKKPIIKIFTASFILIYFAAITDPIATPNATIAVSMVALSNPNDRAKAAHAITTNLKVAPAPQNNVVTTNDS